ncbi:Co2+/Mg2+ efflux protein ApaG [Cohaesibacter haloalkalitolerans]|uniref:Co2+/Mg2+ efflux protein ApaG n=1 Tax=Cohaesibacter haloalkalitolerans TaxID=1162980 RepID=UPI00247948FB|nr:Co2+/Mg2+ efflux protein ApaG [Cohaesibacter haloalkalitolerans]
MQKYTATTGSIQVMVVPEYQPEQSTPDRGQHVWAYHVEICNHGQADIKLQARYWRIIDAQGRIQEVHGSGVVGEHPRIVAGNCFKYSSGCPLDSDSGFMSGHYEMETDDGMTFEVIIPTFSLDIPDMAKSIN